MNVTNSITDFFYGNPYNNPIGSLIERATDSKNKIENWALFMEVCDIINSSEDGPKLAIRAIKRRIVTEMTRDTTIVLYTLTLLETCVKNCGYRFHLVMCSKDFLQEFEKIILNNNNTKDRATDVPPIVRKRILFLIQSWYDSFKSQPDFKEIEVLYITLIDSGIQFPMTDLSTMSPIDTPKKSVISQNKSSEPQADGDTVISGKPPNSPKRVTFSDEEIVQKLSTDLKKVQCNIDVMSGLMNQFSSDDQIPDEVFSLLKNLYEVNTEMQKRLLELINRWEETKLKDSSILFDMLQVNDDMNSCLAQYDRYERAICTKSNSTDNNFGHDEDVQSRISKSNIADVFAAQKEMEHFYNGISKAKINKSDQKDFARFSEESQNLIGPEINTEPSLMSRPNQSAFSNREFDKFLSEQAQSAFSINNDNQHSNRKEKQKTFGKTSKSEKSEFFDL